MTDPIRLRVLKALTTHLQAIHEDDGYYTTLADDPRKVARGRAIFGADDPLPMVSILEGTRSDTGQFAGSIERKDQWTIMIQGWVEDDIDNPTDPAYLLMDDVERRLQRIIAINDKTGLPVYPQEYRLGGLIANLTIPPGIVRPPMEGVSSKAFFYLPVILTIVNPDD